MPLHSAWGRYLVTFAIVGGGAAGSVMGITRSRVENKSKNESYLVHQDGKNNHSDLNGGRHYDQSSESSNNKDASHPVAEEEKILNQLSGPKSEAIDSKKGQGPQSLEEVGPAPKTDLELPPEDQRKEVKALNPEKENSYSQQKSDLGTLRPKSPVEKPQQIKQSAHKLEMIKEPLANKNENSQSKNWFSINLSDEDIFDQREWANYECQKKISGEEALFTCPWTENPSKMIELHLALASDSELKGKRWENVEDLHFISTSENSATLGLVFSDNASREIILILERKIS